MSIIEFSGGQINHRYLMGKSKNDLAHMVMDYLTVWEKAQAEVKRLTQELADANRESEFRGKSWSACSERLAEMEEIQRGGGTPVGLAIIRRLNQPLKLVTVDVDKDFAHLDKLPDGSWRLTVSRSFLTPE